MHLLPPRREALVCLLVCLAASSLLVGRDTSAAGAAPPEPDGCGVWSPPVDEPVVRAFQAPAFAYGPGHRGIDFAAASGTPVRASGDGLVAFAGSVAGSLHVVVAHDGNLRTTYAFLAGIGVRAGDRVARGQVVGTAGSTGPEHEADGVHFGVRLGDRYVDPQRLFAACDLTQLVRLIPADEPPAEPWDPRRVVSGSLTSGGSGVASVAADLAGAFGDAAGVAADAGRSGWDAMSGAAGGAVGRGRAVGAGGARAGREADLIAHSQGGVVVAVFLQDYYDAGDPAYPPIGTIVTLSSPHEGAPLATAAAGWRASPVGRALVEAAEERLPVAPSSSATSVRQLDEHSRFLRDLWDDRLPEHVDFTTIGASDDVIVPATQVDVTDATKVVVDVGGGPLDDHTNIPRDPGALRVVRAALEGHAPPCVGVAEGLRGIVVPTLITRVEHGLGELPVVSR